MFPPEIVSRSHSPEPGKSSKSSVYTFATTWPEEHTGASGAAAPDVAGCSAICVATTASVTSAQSVAPMPLAPTSAWHAAGSAVPRSS
jgi:hypothetical protein